MTRHQKWQWKKTNAVHVVLFLRPCCVWLCGPRMPWFQTFGWFMLHWHLGYLHSFVDLHLQRGFNQMEKGDGAKPSDAPQNGSSSGGIPSTGILESRILALLDEKIFTQRSLRTVQTLKWFVKFQPLEMKKVWNIGRVPLDSHDEWLEKNRLWTETKTKLGWPMFDLSWLQKFDEEFSNPTARKVLSIPKGYPKKIMVPETST